MTSGTNRQSVSDVVSDKEDNWCKMITTCLLLPSEWWMCMLLFLWWRHKRHYKDAHVHHISYMDRIRAISAILQDFSWGMVWFSVIQISVWTKYNIAVLILREPERVYMIHPLNHFHADFCIAIHKIEFTIFLVSVRSLLTFL